MNFPRDAWAEFQPRSALSAGLALAGIVSIIAFHAYYTGFLPIWQDKNAPQRAKFSCSLKHLRIAADTKLARSVMLTAGACGLFFILPVLKDRNGRHRV